MDDLDRSVEFTPAELDLLEDALGDPELSLEGASPKVAARLESFREILGLTDEALPPIDVPAGLLDSVLEEARRSPALVVGAAQGAPAPGLWQRLRSSLLLPGFALAATAALLIIVLRPDGSPLTDMSSEAGLFEEEAAKSESLAESPAEEAAGEAAPPPSAAPAAPAETRSLEADGDAEDEDMVVAEKELAPASAQDQLARDDNVEAKKDARKPAAKSKKSAPAKSSAAPSPEPADVALGDEIDAEDKQALRTLLQQADSDRQRGRCGSAEAAYSKLLGAKGNEEGRALMGLGLCAEARGDVSAAEGFYSRAKAINPALDSLIASERKKLSAPKSERKKSSKAKTVPFE